MEKAKTLSSISTIRVAIIFAYALASCSEFSNEHRSNRTESDRVESKQSLAMVSEAPLEKDWLSSELIQAHLGVGISFIDNPAFFEVDQVLKLIRAPKIVTRHIKSDEEGAWWKTATYGSYCSPGDKACTREPAKEILLNNVSKRKIVAYYRHIWHAEAAAKNPDWRCLDENGTPQLYLQGQEYLSLASPFRDVVKKHLVELVKMGYKAVYFDFKHHPEKGCWDPYSIAQFVARFGTQPPSNSNPGGGPILLSNTKYVEFIKFQNQVIRDAFKEWKLAIQEVDKSASLIISMSYMSSLTTPHLNSEMLAHANVAKSEFLLPVAKGPKNALSFFRLPPESPKLDRASRMSFTYQTLRSAARNQPPHIWFHIPATKQTPPNPGEIVRGIAGIIGMGGIANVHVHGHTLSEPSFQTAFKNAFSATEKWSQDLLNFRKRESSVGIFFSEEIRLMHLLSPEDWWYSGNFPSLIPFLAATNLGLAVGVINDSSLSHDIPQDIKVLLNPYPISSLSTDQKESLARYSARGGKVIQTDKFNWGPQDFVESFNRIEKLLNDQKSELPVYVEFPAHLTSRVYSVLYDGDADVDTARILVIPKNFDLVLDSQQDYSDSGDMPMSGIKISFSKARKPKAVIDLDSGLSIVPRKDQLLDRWIVEVPVINSDLGRFKILR